MFTFLIIFISLLTICVLRYSYTSAFKFSGGRLLGFALTESQYKDPRVQDLRLSYRHGLNRIIIIFLLLHIPLLVLTVSYLSIFILVYTLWYLFLFLSCDQLVKKYIRKLYDLKVHCGWYPPSDFSYTTNQEKNLKLSTETSGKLVNKEHYWSKGYYDNPQDTRIFVASPVQSDTNVSYSLNMGRTGSKVLLSVFWIVLGGFLLWIIISFLLMDFSPYELKIRDGTLSIDAPYYGSEFSMSSIQEVDLLEELPQSYFKNLSRTNGADAPQYLLGNFRNTVLGKAKLYYYKGYLPVIQIRQSDYTILFNTKNSEETREIYKKLLEERKRT